MPLFIFIFRLYLIDVFHSHISVVQPHAAAGVTVDHRDVWVLGSDGEKLWETFCLLTSNAHDI